MSRKQAQAGAEAEAHTHRTPTLWSMDLLQHVWARSEAPHGQQRRLADSLVMCICRGSYEKALRELDNMAGVLPPAQEHAVRQLLHRLQRLKKTDLQLACEMLARQLSPLWNVAVIDSIDTHMPRALLAEIYAQLQDQNSVELQEKLQHWQWMEQTVVRHTLILYVHCTRLKVAQQELDRLQLVSGRLELQLRLLYTFILSFALYLLSFLL